MPAARGIAGARRNTARGTLPKFVVVCSLAACSSGHSFQRSCICLEPAPALRRTLVQSRTSTRRRRAAACRSACCPTPFLSGSRRRGCRGCRRPQPCSSQGWHSKPSSRSSRCLPHGLRWLHRRAGPGHTVAIEAATLADAFRAHSVERPVNNQTHALRPRRPRRARVHHRAARPHHRDAAEMPDSPASAVPACPASFPPHCNLPPPTLTSLDAVDLLNELRHPVPTLQTVPVFVRAGVRRALASSLQHLREAYSILQRTTRRPRPSARMEAVLADTPHVPACSLRGRPSRVVMDAASS